MANVLTSNTPCLAWRVSTIGLGMLAIVSMIKASSSIAEMTTVW